MAQKTDKRIKDFKVMRRLYERNRSKMVDDNIQKCLLFLPKVEQPHHITKEQSLKLLFDFLIERIPGAKENYEKGNNYTMKRTVHVEGIAKSVQFPAGNPTNNQRFAMQLEQKARSYLTENVNRNWQNASESYQPFKDFRDQHIGPDTTLFQQKM